MRITLAPFAPFAALAVLCAMTAGAAPAVAATRNYTITSFDRIRVEGPYAVDVAVGRSSFARATGDQRALDAVSLRVEGRTLYVRADRSAWGAGKREPGGRVTISVGTPELSQAVINGAGSVAIDRLRGLEFTLLVSGSGAGSVGAADVDQLRVSVIGAGTARLVGRAKQFTAVIRGPGSIEAAALASNDATLSALGPATISANAGNSAKVTASGTASVALTGRAACELKISGSATVTGCR